MQVVYIDEHPSSIERDIIYVVSDVEFGDKYLFFYCPCGCEARIMLNLVAPDRPLWKLMQNADNTISVNPSVLQLCGCRSHFWIRNNNVVWC